MKSPKKRIADIRNYLQPLKFLLEDADMEAFHQDEGWQDSRLGLQKIQQELNELEKELDKEGE